MLSAACSMIAERLRPISKACSCSWLAETTTSGDAAMLADWVGTLAQEPRPVARARDKVRRAAEWQAGKGMERSYRSPGGLQGSIEDCRWRISQPRRRFGPPLSGEPMTGTLDRPAARLAPLSTALGLLLLAACSGLDAFQKVTVTVHGSGTGAGTVVATDPAVDIDCTITAGATTAKCADTFDDAGQGGTFNLVATPSAGSTFASWVGCTTTSGTTCTLTFAGGVSNNVSFDVGATFALTGAACNNPVIIQDQFTADAGWTTTANTSGATVPTQTVAYQAAGGNLAGYRKMEHIFTGLGAITVYHDYGATTYNPGVQGAIDHINYTEDQIELAPPYVGAAIGTGFTLTQAGTRYNTSLWPPGGTFTNTAWQTASLTGLTAASFAPGLNFATGGPITFGYIRSNSNTGGAATTLTHGIDNWKVEICR